MIYSTTAKASGGRDGVAELEDGSLTIKMALTGSNKEGNNPEQLFALGYSACFDNAAMIVARKMKLPLQSSETHVTVGLLQDGEGYKLSAKVEFVARGLNEEQTRELAEAAHKVCPYSNALRGNADLDLAWRAA